MNLRRLVNREGTPLRDRTGGYLPTKRHSKRAHKHHQDYDHCYEDELATLGHVVLDVAECARGLGVVVCRFNVTD